MFWKPLTVPLYKKRNDAQMTSHAKVKAEIPAEFDAVKADQEAKEKAKRDAIEEAARIEVCFGVLICF